MDVRSVITDIFRDVLDDPELELADDTVAADIEGWDSLTHISLMFSIEQELGISFSDREMASLDDVGTLYRLAEEKVNG